MVESREESTFVHSKTLGTIFWLNAYRSYGANYKSKGRLCLSVSSPQSTPQSEMLFDNLSSSETC